MRPIGSVLLFACLSACLPSAAAEKDPWASVPPLPTGCYTNDGFADKLAIARGAIRSDFDRQEAINRELPNKAQELDPMELAARQQKFMMEHPEEAMALMQRNQQLGEEYSSAEVAANDALNALQQDLQSLDDRYKTALDKQLAPTKTKFKNLAVRAQKDLVPLGEAGWVYAPWATKEFNQLILEENAAYEKLGAEWWGASGSYHDWLNRLRDLMVKQIPRREEAEEVGAGFLVQLVGTPTASFKPTAALKSVGEYMDEAGKVYARRRTEMEKPMEAHFAKRPNSR